MNNTSERKVAKVLAEVRIKYGITNRKFTKADFFRICQGEGIQLITPATVPGTKLPQYKKLEGSYLHGKELKLIYLRCFWLKRFRRDVAFHELGHHFMQHKGMVLSSNPPASNDQHEWEADKFAALCLTEVRNA